MITRESIHYNTDKANDLVAYYWKDSTEHWIKPCCTPMEAVIKNGLVSFRKIGRAFSTLGLAFSYNEGEQPFYFCPFCGREVEIKCSHFSGFDKGETSNADNAKIQNR